MLIVALPVVVVPPALCPTHLHKIHNEVMQPLPPGTDELRVKVVSKEPLAREFQVGLRKLLFDLLMEVMELIVPCQCVCELVSWCVGGWVWVWWGGGGKDIGDFSNTSQLPMLLCNVIQLLLCTAEHAESIKCLHTYLVTHTTDCSYSCAVRHHAGREGAAYLRNTKYALSAVLTTTLYTV